MPFIKIALVVVVMLRYNLSDATSININEVKAVGCLKVAEGSESFKTLAKDYGALQLEVKMCVFRCWKLRFFYAGMQKGNLCFCGMTIKDTARVPIETCDRRCPGNCYQACGGDTALSVYKTGYVREPVIAMERFSLLKANIGCYARKDSMLILCPKDFAPLRTERMSVPLCIYYCDAMYQTKFSTLTGDDRCCCSNSVTGAKNTMLTWCNIPCAGDDSMGCTGNKNQGIQWATFEIGRAPNFRRWSKSAFLGATWLQPQFPPGENFEVKLKDEEQESLGSLTDLLAKKRARQPGEDANREETDKVAVINLPGGDKRQPSSGGVKEEVAILELPRIKEKSKAETESSVGLIIAAVVVGFVVFTIAFACYVYSIKKNDGDLDEDVEENKNFNRRRGRRRRRNRRSDSSEDTDEDSLSSD